MTQAELAAGRFTKQYVSQIERGEIVPSGELIAWLAERLGVDRMLLETGFSGSDLDRVAGSLADGERLLDRSPLHGSGGAVPRAARVPRSRSATLGPPRRGARRGAGADPAWTPRRGGRAARRSARTGRGRKRHGGAGGDRISHGTARLCGGRHLRRRGRLRAGARPARRGGGAERQAAFRHPPVALALLSARSRLGCGARGHRAGARALRVARRRSPGRGGEPPGLTRRRAPGPLGPRAALRRDLP